MGTIPAVLVGVKCVEWYSCIIQNDYENATLLKDEVTVMLQNMEKDDKVIAYYQMLQFRYGLLIGEPEKHINISYEDLAKSEPYLKYMYYFFSGQKELYEGNYTAAIRLFGIAERLLDNVSDQYERGEFYLRVANGYYRVNQYVYAVSYLNKALDIFGAEESYRNKWLNGQLLLAGIESETNQHQKAENRIISALKQAENYPVVHGLLLQGLGFNQLNSRKQVEALKYFNMALDLEAHSEMNAGMKTKGEVAFIYLRLDETELALPYLEETEIRAKKINNIEYIAKCLIYRNVFLTQNHSKVNDGIQKLKDHELYFEVFEVAKDLAFFYEKAGDLQNAIVYFKLALEMRDKQILIEGDEANEKA